MFGLSRLAAQIIAGAAILILVLGFLQVRSCQQARQKAAESRLQDAQTDALSNSAKDAIATQGRSQAAERASDELTRSNEKDIRDAEGADTKVGAGVNAAGLRSLCRRPVYRDSERCRMFLADPAGLEKGR